MNIVNVLLLILSTVLNTLQSATLNEYSKHAKRGIASSLLFNSLYFIVVTAILAIPCIGKPLPSVYTVTLALIFAVCNVAVYIAALCAYATGPMSYTVVIICSALVIPTFSGAFYGEPVKLSTFIGLALIIICLICSVDKKADEKKASVKWLLFCIAAFIGSGMCGVMQKVHQMSQHSAERDYYVFFAFLFATLFSFFLFFTTNRSAKPKQKGEFIVTKKNVMLLFLTGVGVAGINYINLYLSGVLPSAIAFPVINIAALLLSVVVSLTLFHEKLSKKQTVGLVIGISSVIVICCF